MNGILLVDKPVGMSSHDVVAQVRRQVGVRKVGHAGTLDPAASGLLVLGIGSGTRLLTFLVGLDKVYDATVRFGVTTTTEDAAGEVTAAPGIGTGIPPASLQEAVARYTGTFPQRPSSVSAVKVGGRRAYQRVRAGEDVRLAEREVTVYESVVASQRSAQEHGVPVLDVDLRVRVSSGTYVRALARDLGESVGTGAHLTALRRLTVGPFSVVGAPDPESVGPDTPLLPLGAAASRVLPGVTVAPSEEQAVRNGQRIPVGVAAGGQTALLSPAGDLLAVAHDDDGRWRYDLVVAVTSAADRRPSPPHPSAL